MAIDGDRKLTVAHVLDNRGFRPLVRASVGSCPLIPLADSLPVAFRDHDARDFIDRWARAEAAAA